MRWSLARLDAAHTEEHTARSETQTMPKLRIGPFYLGAISTCVHVIAADFGFAPEALDYVFSRQRAHDHPGVRCEGRSRLPPDETRVGEIVVEPALRETADMVEQRIDDYLRCFGGSRTAASISITPMMGSAPTRLRPLRKRA